MIIRAIIPGSSRFRVLAKLRRVIGTALSARLATISIRTPSALSEAGTERMGQRALTEYPEPTMLSISFSKGEEGASWLVEASEALSTRWNS